MARPKNVLVLMREWLLGFMISLLSVFSFGQEVQVEFSASSSRFDAHQLEESDNYELIELSDTAYVVPNFSARRTINDTLFLSIEGIDSVDLSKLNFQLNDSLIRVKKSLLSDDSVQIILPKYSENYSLTVQYDGDFAGKINVFYPEIQKHKLIIVPLMRIDLNRDSLEQYLNRIYGVAGVEFEVKLRLPYRPASFFDTLMTNPSLAHDRFTDQMIGIRNDYFERYPKSTRKAYYIFVVPRFTNPNVGGYMVKNKAVAFISDQTLTNDFNEVARQLGFGLGGLDEVEVGTDSTNLMAGFGGTLLTANQWFSIQRNGPSIAFYDDYENVKTNSGLIAYYFWEENPDGTINLIDGSVLKAIKRPYKENQPSLHRNIDNFFFMSIFHLWGRPINPLHVIAIGLILLILWFLRKKVFFRLVDKTSERRFIRFLVRLFLVAFAFVAFYVSFIWVNFGYRMFDIEEGNLEYLKGKQLEDVVRIVQSKRSPEIYNEESGSEILVKKGEKWEVRRKKKVLYFNVTKAEDGSEIMKFDSDSEQLKLTTRKYTSAAMSHYMVVRYFDSDNQLVGEKAFNHIGLEITDKLDLADPIKRILVLVNGYRPTSLGSSFEDNFKDIQKNGLEFPNSKNQLYNFDRYEYWNPWNQMDVKFIERINPGEYYYADGHFSVATSNHRSLYNFTTTSSVYPHRCKDPEKHTCMKSVSFWEMFGIATQYNTYELHHTYPNRSGFNKRRENGRIAGRNLYQMLNELPNRSENDTLFIVAHSMGYAYSLGMLDELKGKINLGEFYIIAPENASAGAINVRSWNKVWQYGDDFDKHKYTAPCLMDGIAPQVKVAGLPAENRAFIPEENYRKMGFFDSHFIGYYQWIFDIDKDETGYIKQR